MRSIQLTIGIIFCAFLSITTFSQVYIQHVGAISYSIYPEILDERPDLPSPFLMDNEEEFVIAVTKDEKFAIIPVTLRNERNICKQLVVDTTDFPHLANYGLHEEMQFKNLQTITGRSVEEITELALPGALSSSGFLAADEDIISVIKADNQLVAQMELTHPQLAKTIFHVLNMMDMDLSLNRWNMARHQWDNIKRFYYNDQTVFVEAFDTKGGQKSIFNDGLEGAFHIKIWRELSKEEQQYLENHYGYLNMEEFKKFQELLSFINTGELEPQYIMRYGFYEGHTFWRTDPIAIAFIFGMKSIEELDKSFSGKLNKILSGHHISYQAIE